MIAPADKREALLLMRVALRFTKSYKVGVLPVLYIS